MTDRMQIVEAGIRHADGLSAQLAKPDWRPSRAKKQADRGKKQYLLKGIRP